MQQHLNLGVLPKDICAEIYMSLYGEYCGMRKQKRFNRKGRRLLS